MSVLAFPDRSRRQSKDDWYQSKRHRNGLCTPQSSISNDSVDERDRSPCWDIQEAMSRYEHGDYQSTRDGPAPPMQPAHRYYQQPLRSPEHGRPSLPPLRTVLGDTIASPPATPSSRQVSLQPLPHEPMYDTSTYRPPSLYPGMRPAAEPEWERRAARRSPEYLPRMNSQRPPSPTHRSSNVHALLDQRRDSRLPGDSQQVYGSRYYSTRPGSRSYPSQAATPIQGRSVPDSPTSSHSQLRPPHPEREERAVLGRLHSPSPYWERPGNYPGADPRLHEQIQRIPPDGLPPPSSTTYTVDPPQQFYPSQALEMIRPHGNHTREAAGPASGAYESQDTRMGQSQYFTPALYEYSSGKPRKRSNLPKQSTEIMKRWFDENIHNPYPTEEQKRHFAAMAGINLTQVSNWFINHRRRCPELKDKRDKVGGSVSGREEFY